MKIASTLSSAVLLTVLVVPAWGDVPSLTTDQQEQISHCEIMAQAVQKFAEARDQHLSKPDAFKTVTHGKTDVPGSLVDETLQWAFDHPHEQPETASDHFQERCELDVMDMMSPIVEVQIQSDAEACQHQHDGKPDEIRACIDGKLSAIVAAGGVPAPAPAAVTALTSVVAAAPSSATAPVIESAQTPEASLSAVASAPVPAGESAPTPTVASAPAPAPRPVAAAPMPAAVKPAAVAHTAPVPSVATARPPSQQSIGKLELGMSMAEAARDFDTYGDRDTDADGSPTVSYMVSDDHGYVVLLTEPGKPDTVYGIEIHGGADAKLDPVMGVRLGDGALSLMTHIGEPNSRTPIPHSDNTLWNYDDRNYSFEVSSGGDVITIRIEGYTGLAAPTEAPAAATSP